LALFWDRFLDSRLRGNDEIEAVLAEYLVYLCAITNPAPARSKSPTKIFTSGLPIDFNKHGKPWNIVTTQVGTRGPEAQKCRGAEAQRRRGAETQRKRFNQEVKQQIGKTTLCLCPYEPE